VNEADQPLGGFLSLCQLIVFEPPEG